MAEDLNPDKQRPLSFKDEQFKKEFGCTPGEAELGWRDVLTQYAEVLKQLDEIKLEIKQATGSEDRLTLDDKELEMTYTKNRLECLTTELLRMLYGKLDYDEYYELLIKTKAREI